VPVELWGPTGAAVLRLTLDTGATRRLIHPEMLISVGYDLTQAIGYTNITTGSRVKRTPDIVALKLAALGQTKTQLKVHCHALPANANIDGLLGLDFFRGLNLSIDFRSGLITLS
jgi:hypothetical protein